MCNYGVLPHSVIGNKHRSHAAYYITFLTRIRRLSPLSSWQSASLGERASRQFKGIPRLVGVFVRQTPAEVLDIMDRAGLDIVQLHRRATPEDVAALRASGREIWTLAGGAPGDGVLFDSSHGDGEPDFRKGAYKSILAGRLSAENAVEAMSTGADVLDFNSSLATAPGRKSAALLRALAAALGRI